VQWKRSPGKEGSHYDPNCDLFTPAERNDILTSNAYLVGMLAILAAVGVTMGPAMLFKLYIVPYIVSIASLSLKVQKETRIC
jgi:omega-3 fatty acid desaturase (delta-15 desaturase)